MSIGAELITLNWRSLMAAGTPIRTARTISVMTSVRVMGSGILYRSCVGSPGLTHRIRRAKGVRLDWVAKIQA